MPQKVLTARLKHAILEMPQDVAERSAMLRGYGKKLIELREERNESQSQVADAVNTSVSAIGMYEREERIPRDEIKLKLAEHYGVSVGCLFYAENAT